MTPARPPSSRSAFETARPPSGEPDLSVVIVTYNVRAFLEQALRSVERAGAGLAVETFVVDNASVDGSVEMVRARFPDVRLIANEENAGFARANNQALRLARGRHVLLLNPDTIVQEDTFHTLLRFMDVHPEAGAVGCKILNPDGTFAPESRRAFPSPSVALYRMAGLSRLFPRSRRFGRYNLTYLPEDETAEVDALSGSCMLVRRCALHGRFASDDRRLDDSNSSGSASNLPERIQSTIENTQSTIDAGAGLLDEDFFMYGEDLDWCFRIQQAGWKVYYTPETQIIHYKGESTKKGEFRYVRLFYGAMLLFAEKHFGQGPSRHFAWLLRAGIMAHAAGTVVARGLRCLALPLLDAALTYAVIVFVGLARAAQTGAGLSPLFLATVAPIFAAATVTGIAAARGYRRGRRTQVGPALAGAALGGVAVAAASFFVKAIAFSRLVVLLGMPLVAASLGAWRLLWRLSRVEPQRAVLVGEAREAQRLEALLDVHATPPFTLVGYVTADPPAHGASPDVQADLQADVWNPDVRTSGLPQLGPLRRLRDVVRLRRINHVVFAAGTLSNMTILALVQRLRDLPVRCTMWTEHNDHLIGKASIEHLQTPSLIEADEALAGLHNPAGRRAFEVAVALLGLLLHPFVRIAAWARGPRSFAARLAARTRQMPDVLRGRRALLGYRPGGVPPPPAWGLRPGVFPIEAVSAPDPVEPEAARRVYALYAKNRSFSLDWDILVQSVRSIR